MDATTLQQACDATERVVSRVRADQHGLPTPCAQWDVRDLLNHLLGTFSLGAALLGDTPPTVAMGPGDLPPVDLVGDDAAGAYRLGAEGLLAAAAGDSLSRPHTTPLGEMPGAVLGGFTALDIVVHGWDLAVATGQDRALDDSLAEQVLAFARQTITDDTRAPRIGPEIAVRDGASATDRLVAYLGRQP